MSAVVFMLFACLNALVADHNFRKRRPTFGALCAFVALFYALEALGVI